MGNGKEKEELYELKEEDEDVFIREIKARKVKIKQSDNRIGLVITGLEDVLEKIPNLTAISIKKEDGTSEVYVRRPANKDAAETPLPKENGQFPVPKVKSVDKSEKEIAVLTSDIFQSFAHLLSTYHSNQIEDARKIAKSNQEHMAHLVKQKNGFGPKLIINPEEIVLDKFVSYLFNGNTEIKYGEPFGSYLPKKLISICLSALSENIVDHIIKSKGKTICRVIHPIYKHVIDLKSFCDDKNRPHEKYALMEFEGKFNHLGKMYQDYEKCNDKFPLENEKVVSTMKNIIDIAGDQKAITNPVEFLLHQENYG